MASQVLRAGATGETKVNTDFPRVERLSRIAQALHLNTSDGRAGAMAILREIEEVMPGTVGRLQADLQLQSVRRAYPHKQAQT
ncbi:MAG: hypothetical protein JWR59_1303 [Brevundimonas sp.]|nr:hypothetical protein [Brevundimonas sp.]